jgi:hypothetical protein
MKELKDYWWMIITIPALTILIYLLTKKSMKGLAILSIIFGIAVITSWNWILAYPIKGNINLLLGITWLALGIEWFFYHYRKKVR